MMLEVEHLNIGICLDQRALGASLSWPIDELWISRLLGGVT